MSTADIISGDGSGITRSQRRPVESILLVLLVAAAIISVLVTIGIVYILLSEALPFFGDVNVVDFLTGTTWQPAAGEFGVLPLLVASLQIAAIAALVAVPLGLGAAIYLSEYASETFRRIVKPILELLAGMPTVVLGFFAIVAITPALQDLGVIRDGQAFSMLSAGIVVGFLITPTVSSLSEDALRAVPESMRQGAYGLGATRMRVSTQIVFPAALSGIMASVVLAISRAVGETLAVTLAAGAQPNLTSNITEPGQSITSVIVATSLGEATRGSIQYQSIFALGLLLFAVTLLINIVAAAIVKRFRTVYS